MTDYPYLFAVYDNFVPIVRGPYDGRRYLIPIVWVIGTTDCGFYSQFMLLSLPIVWGSVRRTTVFNLLL